MSRRTMKDPGPFLSILRLGMQIQQINQKMEHEIGVSLTQWSLLRCMVDNPTISALDLAQELGVQPSTLTQILKRLERKKYIFVTKDPLDARRKLLSLTRAGNSTLLEANRTIAALEKHVKFSNTAVREISRGLTHLL
ncbi:MAG: hypothetical protein A2070_10010 [Bdellovibrionales bacterium GWC1_52_8]|nr:MAG: hypothetical protein A2Z97_11795 [Bdellovibrionales bacterium GWB1_52_6]OFZ05356.1 MAG: hypothetical protein A2X97_16560 [Bdellovibrionales bacterium GWA1_52_35]OFZ36357.1 MAG: hypothetical protein A2070_10010 [Bdellovibrionales bacterium GWC1_52_8]